MSLFERAKSVFSPSPETRAARRLFASIMVEARRPELYLDGGVPDTIDGRFDLVSLHLYLVLRRLKGEGAAGQALGQRLFDAAFANFDEALREMGVGDLSVGKKIRKMAEAFYGRVEAYEHALASGDEAAFEAALVRNIYRGAAPSPGQLAALAQTVARFRGSIGAAPLAALLDGSWTGAQTASAA